MATIDNAYGRGVVYTASIDLGAASPLDSRIAVQTITERDAHVTGNRAFAGMQVYVADEEKTYIYNGTDWDVLVTDADLTEGVDIKVPIATSGTVGGILSGTDITVDGSGNVTVNQAAKLTTARTVTFADGDVTGFFTFDGSADVSGVNLTVGGLADKVSITDQTGTVDLTGATVNVKTLSREEAQSAEGTTAASIQFVSDVVDARIAQSDAMVYKGTVADKTTITDVNTTAKTGWTYRVTADLDFTGDDYIVSDVKEAHAGDLIICRTDGSVETPATWDIVKHNDDGQVIGPESSVADRIVTFAGSTGKVVKDSGKTLADISSEIDTDISAAKTELIGTSSDTSNLDTINAAKKYADEKVAASAITSGTIAKVEDGTDESISISGNAITVNLKNYALDTDLTTAEGEIDALQTLTAGLGAGVTVKQYVDTAVSGVSGNLTTLEGEVDANTAKLAGLTEATVVEEIDSKVSAAISALNTYEAYTSEEVTTGIADWF